MQLNIKEYLAVCCQSLFAVNHYLPTEIEKKNGFFSYKEHRYLGCFQYLAIVNRAAMNIGVHRFFWIGVSSAHQQISGSKTMVHLHNGIV